MRLLRRVWPGILLSCLALLVLVPIFPSLRWKVFPTWLGLTLTGPSYCPGLGRLPGLRGRRRRSWASWNFPWFYQGQSPSASLWVQRLNWRIIFRLWNGVSLPLTLVKGGRDAFCRSTETLQVQSQWGTHDRCLRSLIPYLLAWGLGVLDVLQADLGVLLPWSYFLRRYLLTRSPSWEGLDACPSWHSPLWLFCFKLRQGCSLPPIDPYDVRRVVISCVPVILRRPSFQGRLCFLVDNTSRQQCSPA